jgi:hypothetical protein
LMKMAAQHQQAGGNVNNLRNLDIVIKF